MGEEPLLPEAVRRVEMEAMLKGLPIRIVRTQTTARTAEEAAAAVGTGVARIVKSLVFRGRASGRAYLLLVPGDRRVDEARAGSIVGEAIERPDADFVREATGFAIGGVSPLGSGLPVFMDRRLLAEDAVWSAAGTPFHVFEARPRMLAEAVGATIVDL